MLQKTHARLGDTSNISFVSATLYQSEGMQHLMIRTTTDPCGVLDSANPRFLPLIKAGQSYEIWRALVDCFLSLEETSDSHRVVLEDSQGNLLTLFCVDSSGIIVGTETSDERQGAEVIIENDHPFFPLLLNVFEAIEIANARDPSKMVTS